jgi:hypothetical protein
MMAVDNDLHPLMKKQFCKNLHAEFQLHFLKATMGRRLSHDDFHQHSEGITNFQDEEEEDSYHLCFPHIQLSVHHNVTPLLQKHPTN